MHGGRFACGFAGMEGRLANSMDACNMGMRQGEKEVAQMDGSAAA